MNNQKNTVNKDNKQNSEFKFSIKEEPAFRDYLMSSNVLPRIQEIADSIYGVNYDESPQAKGSWTQSKLDKHAFNVYVQSLIRTIGDCSTSPVLAVIGSSEIDKFTEMVDSLSQAINDFNAITMVQFKQNTPQHYKHIIEAFFHTFSPYVDIFREVTGYSDIQEYANVINSVDKVVVQVETKLDELTNSYGDTSDINSRLNLVRKKVSRLEDKSEDLDNKVVQINQASDSVGKLPQLIEELESAKADMLEIKEQSDKDKFKSEQNIEESDGLLANIRQLNVEAIKLVEQCRNARHITMTESLAKGFETKAGQLKVSIRLWVAGLVFGLGGGAVLAHLRVSQLSSLMEKDLTSGQAILQIVISIFALGGPLWWAWLCTSQINKIFKLSEDYSYKASIAKAYTGFQDEAAKFDNKLAERLFTSTVDRFDELPLRLIDSKDHSSPWHEFANKPFQRFFGSSKDTGSDSQSG
ncbi:hypothetical protein RFA51_001260 [Vibrio fluvialis]|nr:hypothetical protein [Vibrio fluvialis]ELI1828953.1 hypothetical protein [Vibrio fluvialis]